ncbi:GNAT family N-acetyltransferase [Pyrococcus sp. NA2]|uniref:GNAT family N-acetyltransferase n=1 Tax=Pyrococcus sp. (strain NA2) TaxID=342949 RepID=UPI00064E2DEB|nr:GNAT family N-acetyltransferase [Pyrococcus sp. NA2]
MEIELVKEPLKLKDNLLKLVSEVYKATKGGYPALEWVEKKPEPNDFEGFRKVYEPFLEFRLTKEFDELYIAREREKILGTVALVYRNLGKKGIWWIPEELANEKTGLIEFFIVHPDFQGRGIGSKLLSFARNRLRALGKKPYVITFPNLRAYEYYIKRGFREVMRYKEFVILEG